MWSLENIRIDSLLEHPKNPRMLTNKQYMDLSQSIEKFGLIDKPIINADYLIIGGHQRLKVLAEEGCDYCDCWVPSRLLNQDEVDELNIRLNKNTGDWDWDILANDWEMDDLMEWGFTIKDFHMEPQDKPLEEKECEKCPECNQKIRKKNH
jgi:ParB-like chromosome segregation protein Spo0J